MRRIRGRGRSKRRERIGGWTRVEMRRTKMRRRGVRGGTRTVSTRNSSEWRRSRWGRRSGWRRRRRSGWRRRSRWRRRRSDDGRKGGAGNTKMGADDIDGGVGRRGGNTLLFMVPDEDPGHVQQVHFLLVSGGLVGHVLEPCVEVFGVIFCPRSDERSIPFKHAS